MRRPLSDQSTDMNKRPQKLEVSKHAMKRCRERMGVPKKAVVRMAKKALKVGKHQADSLDHLTGISTPSASKKGTQTTYISATYTYSSLLASLLSQHGRYRQSIEQQFCDRPAEYSQANESSSKRGGVSH